MGNPAVVIGVQLQNAWTEAIFVSLINISLHLALSVTIPIGTNSGFSAVKSIVPLYAQAEYQTVWR